MKWGVKTDHLPRTEERSQLLPRSPIECKIGVDNFAEWPLKCCWYCKMIGAYGSHDGCREALHGSCMLLQPSQSLYFSFVQIKVHFCDVTEDFKCRTLKIATWCGFMYCIQIQSRIQPLGILSSLLHDTPDVRDGLEWMHWTGLDWTMNWGT